MKTRGIIDTWKNTGLLLLFCLLAAGTARGQRHVAIKTNFLHAATTTPNFGVEFAVHPRLTVDLWGAYNLVDFRGNTSLRHYLFQPELRYWFCRTFEGHFTGIHAFAGRFDIGGISFIKALKNYHYRGPVFGAGFTYGYHWIIGRRWGLEAAVGVGYARLRYDKYRCAGCADIKGRYKRDYFGPTKAAVTLLFFIN